MDENEFVLETYRSGEQAVGELNVRFDNNPNLVQRLRLVLLEPTGVQHAEWPRGGSLAERAGALARQLSIIDALSDTDLDDIVRAHFLRGEMGRTQLAGEQRRSIELWWYADDGKHDPVGLLVERREERAWQLLLDGRTRGLTNTQLHQRIAHVMRELGEAGWTDTEVAQVLFDLEAGQRETRWRGPAAVCVHAQLLLAQVLHVTQPLGRQWP